MQAGFFPFFSSSIFKRYCKSGFCYLSCEGQKIYHKGFYYANFFASLLFRLINANISVNDFNEQPEWFHWPWAHRQWPFYTYCMSCTRFKSGSFYRYRKRFGDLHVDQCTLQEKLFDSQAIQTSRVVEFRSLNEKFTGPNKTKNNFTCFNIIISIGR